MAALAELHTSAAVDPPPGAPSAEFVVAPRSVTEVSSVLEAASDEGLSVLVWGGGTHQGYGATFTPDVLLLTGNLDELVAWEPDDLTAVVGSGMSVRRLEEQLGERGQTAVLPETGGASTVGGVVAAGVSGWRRARYGPTRDRVLEVNLVTGDGRAVKGGGRVVKNVTGYDLPRLATGSFGGLGIITQVCLKLWPLPEATMTVSVRSAEEAQRVTYRPLAVLEERHRTHVYLAGTRPEVEGQAAALGGDPVEGLAWPDAFVPLSGEARWSLRVPPAKLVEGLTLVPTAWSFIAQHGVGMVDLLDPGADPAAAMALRTWAEIQGGAFVMVDAPQSVRSVMDPWGTPPSMLETQRRLIARFDPARVVNPGRLPGGL